MKQRLHKIIAQSTELSRRAAEKAMTDGEITVNGKVVTKMGSLADPEVDVIKWKNKKIDILPNSIYLMYNKPKGKLVTKKDMLGRSTIWSDLQQFKAKVNSVGRLDGDSEGLLILTNDGDLINHLTHPKHEKVKVYRVKVKGHPKTEDLEKIRNGLKDGRFQYLPAHVCTKGKTDKNTWLEVKLTEGKNRQIRRMFYAIGHSVMKLKRIAVGAVALGDLEASKWRFLTGQEIKSLKS